MRIPQTILTVLGTRPEIIKLSPLLPRLPEIADRAIIVHTGQHFSYEMDELFFKELELPSPDYTLKCGSAGASPVEQTARMLAALEYSMKIEQPSLVIVQGDTNSTLAGALTASKLDIPVLHLEAGCRSFNRAMPEEINRVLVDHISTLLLAADEVALRNLQREGCQRQARLYLTGSTGLAACRRAAHLARQRPLLKTLKLAPEEYMVATIHRAENTTPQVLPGLVKTINQLSYLYPVVIPVHPRTKAALKENRLELSRSVIQLEPLGYLDMLALTGQARVVLTDSGGLQEEAAVLGVPVLVLRNETEWTYLVEAGKATLVGNTYPQALQKCLDCLQPEQLAALRRSRIPVAENITETILAIIASFFKATPYLTLNEENYVQV